MTLKELLAKLAGKKNSAGETLNTSALSAEAGEVVLALINEATSELSATAKKAAEELVAANTKITALEAQIADSKKTKPEPKDKGKDKGKADDDDGEDEKVPAWAQKLTEELGAIKAEREAEKNGATSRSLIDAAANKLFPNLKLPTDTLREEFAERLAGIKPKDAAEAEAAVKKTVERLASLAGAKVESWTASPSKEGAKDGDTGSSKDQEAKERQRIEAIRRAGATQKF